MPGKRDRLVKLLQYTSMLDILERLPRRPRLVVINYHRIGYFDKTPFDPGVFSASQDILSDQVRHLKKNYDLVTPEDAIDIIAGKAPLRSTAILITFDDGYLDNYELALPVLQTHDAKAIFFLVTAYLDDPHQAPWWDAIAWLVRRCAGRTLSLTYPSEFEVAVDEANINTAIAEVLQHFKGPEVDGERFLTELEREVGASRRDISEDCRLFMNWEEAAQMRDAGMTIGLHTHTHRILSQIDAVAQRWELSECRARLSDRLGEPGRFFAYPVGSREAFTETTKRLVEEVGFDAAFSFYGGVNKPNEIDPYDVRRFDFTSDVGSARARATMVGVALTGMRL